MEGTEVRPDLDAEAAAFLRRVGASREAQESYLAAQGRWDPADLAAMSRSEVTVLVGDVVEETTARAGLWGWDAPRMGEELRRRGGLARVDSAIGGYVSRQVDGDPCLVFFAAPWAFAWSGKPGDPIEVSYGGAGEPVTNLIDLGTSYLGTTPGLRTAIQHFTEVCTSWAYTDEDELGERVRVVTAESGSRQHYIDTGRWLFTVVEDVAAPERAALVPPVADGMVGEPAPGRAPSLGVTR